ncbi:hypothetical protein NQ176_g2371 [Zarea fungicola]|uniref:Uncharacterized protein n=1 Tax=Zarea fungicola TaxID=93591 RepID=A0ACC1NP99_9HYPO|nr:hypothetical protein NQ176_g2371 [Lecanicillium fungicola]
MPSRAVVLVVLTSVSEIIQINKPTGWYLPEFAYPYNVISPNVDVVVASPMGGVAPLDPESVQDFQDPASQGRSSEFAAIYYPGGHGPMFDLVDDPDSIALIQEFYEAGKPVATVCHGSIVLVNAKVNGKYIADGRNVTGMTNEEEDSLQMTAAMPFLVEDRLKADGANFIEVAAFQENVIVDGQLITGQNPASAQGVGLALAKALGFN